MFKLMAGQASHVCGNPATCLMPVAPDVVARKKNKEHLLLAATLLIDIATVLGCVRNIKSLHCSWKAGKPCTELCTKLFSNRLSGSCQNTATCLWAWKSAICFFGFWKNIPLAWLMWLLILILYASCNCWDFAMLSTLSVSKLVSDCI